MRSAIRSVETEVPEPPYPADTKARGWKFDVDVERLKASDTWALARPEHRPWLLMVWVESWSQIPVGSYPDDDEIIAARIGMPHEQFSMWRKVLMRGWRRHSDGRLYHPVIAERVLSMGEYIDEFKLRQSAAGKASAAARRERFGTAQPSNHGSNRFETGSRTGLNCPEPIPTPTPTPTELLLVAPNGATRARPAVDHVPYARIVDLYHEMLPELPRVAKLTAARKAAIRARWKGKDAEDLQDWVAYFQLVRRSRFLMGLVPPSKDRKPFLADLEWLIKEANFTKVLEGRYE